MKTKFSNSEICHVFAQQQQEIGEACNIFMKNDNFKNNYANKIYSYGYHYLLAEFINSNTVLINNKGYSNSTSKHISLIIGATRQYKQFFTMNCDIDLVYNQIMTNKNKLARANKPELYIDPIFRLYNSIIDYYTYINKLSHLKKHGYFKEIKKLVDALNTDSEGLKEKLNKLAIDKAKKQARKDKKELKEKLVKFTSFDINSFRIGNFDYLRISKDKTQIETSQQIKIDIDKCKLLYKLIKAGKDIKGYKLDYYTVISINGSLKIGCHNIHRNEINRIANLLNW